ncbi:hypothetical protein F511_13256 [Dorcoceras hygrometricum]|uniref:Uncharacterized protein n=1 Tax=Dorcoceras hygrometricum TaxID=472368 RepID=A0A2Z7AAY1_9LAMI|nr:hypothetical protein F511_13256 [Dorcoceras hygrometricum]
MSRMMILCGVTLIFLWVMSSPSVGCPSDGSGCQNCLATRMKSGCPGCASIMQCMDECLQGGNSRSKCVKRCDCSGEYPRLADCKKCLSKCKCSCSVSRTVV